VRELGLDNGWTADDVKNQVLMALSLLCRFGGIGSKSRKGFGSLHWNEAWSLEKCRNVASQFAIKLNPSNTNAAPDYSFKTAIQKTINIPTDDAWLAIDKLGLAAKQFASSKKHDPKKAALGLPKQIHGPLQTPMRHQIALRHQKPLKLKGQFERFAAPIWYHFEPSDNGLKLNILAFPSARVVDIDSSTKMLNGLCNHLAVTLINVGSKISGKLLAEKTKKGGWKVETAELGIGSIQNSADIPADKNPDDIVNLEVKIAKNDGSAQFKYML
jgi:CRISPR-associated protein Cmr6